MANATSKRDMLCLNNKHDILARVLNINWTFLYTPGPKSFRYAD
jgi:hypothetical protein